MVRILLFAILFYLVYMLLKRLIYKPFRDGYSNNRRNRNKHNGNWNSTFRTRKEGNVTITYSPEQAKQGGRKVGEYVDYEEVD